MPATTKSFTLPSTQDCKQSTESSTSADGEDKPQEQLGYVGNEAVELSYSIKVFTAVLSFGVSMSSGLESGMKGTTLPDQRDRLGATMEQMGLINTTVAIFNLISVFLAGIIVDRKRRMTMLYIGIYLIITSIILPSSKYLTSYGAYLVFYTAYKFFHQGAQYMYPILTLVIWQESSSGPMYLILMGFYVGGTLGPFIAKPFLSPEEVEHVNCTNYTVTCANDDGPLTTIEPPRFPDGSQLEIPFWITSVFIFILGVCFLLSHKYISPLLASTVSKTKDKVPYKELLHYKSCMYSTRGFTMFFLIAFCLHYLFNAPRLIPINDFLFIYATESSLGFTKDQAANIDSISYLCGLFGRLFSGLASKCLPIQATFGLDVSVTWLTAIGVAIWGGSSQLGFVICAWGHSLFSAPMWPGCITLTDQYIYMTGVTFVLQSGGASIGSAVLYPIYGGFYDCGIPEATMYGVLIFASMQFLIHAFRQAAGLKQGTRFASIKESENEGVEVVKYDVFNTGFISSIDVGSLQS